GGRDNRISNNLFDSCGPALSIDARVVNWVTSTDPLDRERYQALGARLDAAAPERKPFSRYPELARIRSEDFPQPVNNRVDHNVCAVGGWVEFYDGLNERDERHVALESNLVGV